MFSINSVLFNLIHSFEDGFFENFSDNRWGEHTNPNRMTAVNVSKGYCFS